MPAVSAPRWDATAQLWRCRRSIAGRTYLASFAAKPDAVEWLRNLTRHAAGLEPLARPVTLAEAWELYQVHMEERGGSPETLRHYRGKLAALQRTWPGTTTLHTITQAEVSAYLMARRRAGLAGRTIRYELGLLHRMTRRAGVTPRWTMPEIRVQRHHRHAPSPDDVAALWLELRGPARVALALCLLTGMRASEAMRLDAAAVDLRAWTITLTGRKTDDEILVAVVPTLAALLPSSGPLVAGTAAAVRMAFKRASDRVARQRAEAALGRLPRKATAEQREAFRTEVAKVYKWSGPGLGRHCFGTWAVQFGGFTTYQVADGLGHSLPGVATPGYIHAQAVEPVRRPMSEAVERVLLAALAARGSAPVSSSFRSDRSTTQG